nr:G protein-coupled receptor [Proales similis]
MYYGGSVGLSCAVSSVQDMNLTSMDKISEIDYREYDETDLMGIYRFNWLDVRLLSKELVLNGSLTLSQFRFLNIWFEGFSGIDYNFNPNAIAKRNMENALNFNFGALNFYSNSVLVSDCDASRIDLSKNGPFHGYTASFGLSIDYRIEWCPLLFHNSKITWLRTVGLVNSFLKHNVLRFKPISGDVRAEFSTEIVQWKIYNIYKIQIDTSIVAPEIVRRTWSILIWGVVDRIESDVLRANDFNVKLTLQNPRAFFASNAHWLSELNYNYPNESRSIGLFQYAEPESPKSAYDPWRLNMGSFYHYPDHDFCLFAHYPVNQTKYFFSISHDKQLTCTCSILWLMQNRHKYSPDNKWDVTYSWLSDEDCKVSSGRIHACQFKFRLELCKIESISTTSSLDWRPSVIDIVNAVLAVKYVTVILIQPVFSLIAVLLNLAIIVTLQKLRRRRVNRLSHNSYKMYANIELNSACHIALSVLFVFEPLVECIQEPNGIYCNSIFIDEQSRLFYLLGLSFVGNAAKLCCNVSLIAFSLHRYLINNANARSSWLSGFQRRSPFKLFAVVLILSLLLSSVRLFVNERLNLINFMNKKDFVYLVDPFGTGYQANAILVALFVLNQAFNDVIANLLTLYIDFKLYKVHKANESKRSVLLGSNSNMQQIGDNLIRLIVTNGILTAMLRLPELLAVLYKLFHILWPSNRDLCFFTYDQTSSLCHNIYTISQFFYSITSLLNFFLFFKFDSNFRSSLKSIFSTLLATKSFPTRSSRRQD